MPKSRSARCLSPTGFSARFYDVPRHALLSSTICARLADPDLTGPSVRFHGVPRSVPLGSTVRTLVLCTSSICFFPNPLDAFGDIFILKVGKFVRVQTLKQHAFGELNY